ncbi:MAG: hypothetical protein GF346_03505 [Candidatus Eisenbacteria bacterium]|nr:hypothetical protein [Candidatus Latescibacterota bacterium]MBD3301489.1 hypothetical protein [Candidatus Eisenbacteria bacterium]
MIALQVVGLLGSLLFAVAVGDGCLRLLLGRQRGRFPRAARIGLAFALGEAAISLWMIGLGFAGLRFSVAAVLPLAVVPLLARLRERGRGRSVGEKAPAGGPRLLPVPVAAALIIASSAVVLLGSFQEPIAEVDAVAHWAMHAKVFTYERTAFPPFLTAGGVGEGVSHWPPLLPLAQTWSHLVMGAYDDQLIKGIFPAFYLAVLAVLLGTLRRFLPRGPVLAGVVLWATLPSLIVPFPAGSVASAYADAPLSLFLVATAAALLFWVLDRSNRSLILAGICAAAALWMKREGIAFAGVSLVGVWIGLLFGGREIRSRSFPAAVGFTMIVAASVAVQMLYKARFPGPFTGDPIDLGFLLSAEGIERTARSGGYLLREAFHPGRWGFLWISLAFLGIARVRRIADRPIRLLLFLLAGQLAAALVGMAVSEFSIERIAHLDMRRVLIQVAPLAAMAIAFLASPRPEESLSPASIRPRSESPSPRTARGT